MRPRTGKSEEPAPNRIVLERQRPDVALLPIEGMASLHVGLIEYANGDCVFFDPQARKCTVYNGRPRQCRTWPFWQSNVQSEEAWKQTCEVCPGSGQGKLYPVEQVLHQISIVRL